MVSKTVRLGDELAGGWIVGPISPETGNVMAIAPEKIADIKGNWNDAQVRADFFQEKGHNNARQPSVSEALALREAALQAGYDGLSLPDWTMWTSECAEEYGANARSFVYMDDHSAREGNHVGAAHKGTSRYSFCVVRDEPGLTLGN